MRHVTLFFCHSGPNMKGAEMKMRDMYKGHAPNYKACWYKRFKMEDYTLGGKNRSGRPPEFNLSELQCVVKTDPFHSTRQMASTLGVHSSTTETGLKNLGVKKKLG
ncbi:hypothetical protein TELCIR_16821 [Teladorsagia circumcincta]|uniref:Mos1 transposase HTH domain-containing protein n=1 Tax=Teladorsagia circumcincta TaxID=45464 RepID=A0A2G9TWM0_TELCI|nr:hypothetical protein TELCIR_16821 [Teladorsagia circumcincta]